MGIDPIRADSKLKIIIEFFVLHLYADGTMTEHLRAKMSCTRMPFSICSSAKSFIYANTQFLNIDR